MPPDSPALDQNDIARDFATLTDQTIAILYQIIRSAESNPEVESRPFRAIFSAYHTVLAENALDPQHDQVYLRFLFRLGDRREEGTSLYEKFERLLDEIGIRIEFDEADNDGHEITRNIADVSSEDEKGANEWHGIRRTRRASIQSTYDAEDESTGVFAVSKAPKPSNKRSRINSFSEDAKRFNAQTHIRTTEKALSDPPTPGKRSVGAPKTRPALAKATPRRIPSLSPAKSTAFDGQNPQFSEAFVKSNDSRLVDNSGLHQIGPRLDVLSLTNREFLYEPSKTQLLRDADTFYDYRIRSIALGLIRTWCDQAVEAKHLHEQKRKLAVKHDANTLIRQGFEFWRLRLAENRRAAEIRQYFDRLGKRATAARNLYLMAKAFSHWSHCAEEEELKNSLARGHILALKYFYAWREIAIGNQAKAEAHMLRGPLNSWKQRYFRLITSEIKADLAHQRNLIKRSYWKWFWGFCERRAPQWHSQKLRQGFFTKWINSFRFSKQRNLQVTLHVERAAKKYFLSQWLSETKCAISNRELAHVFNEQRIAAGALRTWTRDCSHRPLALQLSNMVDWRVAGTTFATIVNVYRFEKQAGILNRLRLLRNYWTLWNDRLRWQTFSSRIDDRRLLESLYKWTIAERQMLMKRVCEQKRKQHFFSKIKTQLMDRQSRRDQVGQIIKDQRQRRSVQLILSYWQSRQKNIQQSELVAAEFRNPKVFREIFELLSRRRSQLQPIHAMVDDAAFYFSTKKCMKRWRSRLIESKRQKRREAYMQVRRSTKIRMASNIIRHWKTSANIKRQRLNEAKGFDLNRQLRIGTYYFYYWKNLYDFTIDQSFQADEHFENSLLQQAISQWIERSQRHLQLEETAAVNESLRAQSLAFTCLNRMHLRIIELKGPLATADNLRLRYERRHFYNMIRRWHDKTASRTQKPIRTRPMSARAKKTRLLSSGEDSRLGQTARAEDMTELEPIDLSAMEPPLSSTPLRGYSSTPSKRAARARALLQESTTPIGTPFQNRIRAQLNVTPRSSNQTPFKSSTALRRQIPLSPPHESQSVRFEAEDEDEK